MPLRSRLVAEITRTLTRMICSPPTRWNSPSCSTRSSLACEAPCRSPTSSRKIVPPSASSNLPRREAVAPVNEPFSCPNSSVSISSVGMAAQFTLTNGPAANGLELWMWAASSSLPVPDSPISSTRASERAAMVACSTARSQAGLEPIILGVPPTSSRSRSFSCRRLDCSRAFFTASSTRSRPSGFSRKSKAPARVASTASAMVPWPEIMMAGDAAPFCRTALSRSMPLPSGSLISSR